MTTFGITVYIISAVLTGILFALKRIVVVQDYSIEKVSLIDIFILTLRALLLMGIPILNSLYVLIHTLAWKDCIDDLRDSVRDNHYRLC